MADLDLPYLAPQTGKQQRQLVQFGGVDYGDQPAAGALSDARNLSTRLWPSLTQREERGDETPAPEEGGAFSSMSAAFAWAGKLVWVDGTTLYYDGENMGTVEAGEKRFAVVNTKLCIWPDKKYIDLEKGQMFDLGASYQNAAGTTVTRAEDTLTFEEVHKEKTLAQTLEYVTNPPGDEFSFIKLKTYSKITRNEDGTFSTTGEKESVVYNADAINELNGRYLFFWDAEGVVDDLIVSHQYWYGDMNEEELQQDYTPIDSTGYFGKLIGGATDEEEELGPGATLTTLRFSVDVLDGRSGNVPITTTDLKAGDVVKLSGNVEREGVKIESVSDYSITFTGEDFGSGSWSNVKIERVVPDLDFICESENRLWGVDAEGTIHASALGDPTNFNDFSGVSTDSYSVAVGTDGDFTGCVAYSGSVLFFKENVLHKVIGSYPAEYAIYTYSIPGIQAGCEKSAVVINEVLYYKGRNGVYAYTGGTPVNIGRAFGTRRFEEAVGGTDGARYYLSMKEEGGGWGLWVYDPSTGLWIQEDETQVTDFIEFPDRLEFLSGNKVYGVSGSGEGRFPWAAQFAPFYDGTQNRKRHNKLLVRLDLSAGAWAQIEVRRDSGLWTKVWKQTGRRRNSYLVPVLPLRCDSFEVRVSGEGGCILRGLTWQYAVGSEV